MDFFGFQEWLQTEKNMSVRSAHDVISRLKRVLLITDEETITEKSTEKLNASNSFSDCSMFIKSQLRRSISLYLEYRR